MRAQIRSAGVMMDLATGENLVAQSIARAMIEGFDKHYRIFREACQAARRHFENGSWPEVQRALVVNPADGPVIPQIQLGVRQMLRSSVWIGLAHT